MDKVKNYPATATGVVTFNANDEPTISVKPKSLAVAANGTLKWKCTGNVKSFRIVMKDANRTPFAGGKTETGGISETPDEAVEENAYHGPSDPNNTYSYTAYCTDKDGKEHELDPEVVVGPPY